MRKLIKKFNFTSFIMIFTLISIILKPNTPLVILSIALISILISFKFGKYNEKRKKTIIAELKKRDKVIYKDNYYNISTSIFIKEDIDIYTDLVFEGFLINRLFKENVIGKCHLCKTTKDNYFIYETFYDRSVDIIPMELKDAKLWLLEKDPATYNNFFGELKEK